MNGSGVVMNTDDLPSTTSPCGTHWYAQRGPIRRSLFGGIAGAPSSRGGDWLKLG